LFMTSVKFFFILKKHKMQPYDNRLLIGLGIGLFSFIPSLLLPVLDSLYLDIFIRTMLVSILFLAGLLLFKPSEEINVEILKYWGVFKSFFNRS